MRRATTPDPDTLACLAIAHGAPVERRADIARAFTPAPVVSLHHTLPELFGGADDMVWCVMVMAHEWRKAGEKAAELKARDQGRPSHSQAFHHGQAQGLEFALRQLATAAGVEWDALKTAIEGQEFAEAFGR